MPVTYTTETISCDVLVIGGGAAGCCAAMAAMERNASVCLAVKGSFGQIGIRGAGASSCGNTEGGNPRLPNVPGVPFNEEQMYDQAIMAGLGLADRNLVRTLVEGAEETREDLERWGWVPKSTGPAGLGHPIVKAVQKSLLKGARVLEHTMIVDAVIQNGICTGALGVDRKGCFYTINAGAVIIATGGNAQLFKHNVHPACCTGDGYALALRAGVPLMNMEFMQIFTASVYPTRNLVHTWKAEQLETLYNGEGASFLETYLPEGVSREQCLKENVLHAPFSTRDRASRYLGVAIVKEAIAGRVGDHGGVFIDLRKTADLVKPEVREFFSFKGINLEKDPIEISMVHQCSNGGILVDSNAMTEVPGLFAAGEAITGTHGADRIGGNMLAQCAVFGRIAGKEAARFSLKEASPERSSGSINRTENELYTAFSEKGEEVVERDISSALLALQSISWEKGLVMKTGESLKEWNNFLGKTTKEWERPVSVGSSRDLIRVLELRNLLLVGEAVCGAMKKREESRGPHYREDFPDIHSSTKVPAIVLRCENKPGEARISTEKKVIDPEWSDFTEYSLGNKRWG